MLAVDQYPFAFFRLFPQPKQSLFHMLRGDGSYVRCWDPLVRLAGMFRGLVSPRWTVNVGTANVEDGGDPLWIVVDEFVRVVLTAEPQVLSDVVHRDGLNSPLPFGYSSGKQWIYPVYPSKNREIPPNQLRDALSQSRTSTLRLAPSSRISHLSWTVSRVKAGSELKLDVVMTNTSDEQVGLTMWPDDFRVDVRDSDGKPVGEAKQAGKIQPPIQGQGSSQGMELAPHFLGTLL
jgi:hypothetical protein